MLKMPVSVLVFALVAIAHAASAGITVSHVIGKEFPGAYKHPAAITELDNGDLYVAYYGGGGEYEDDSKVWGMRRKAGETAWSTPVIIADTPFLGEGNPVVWQAPDGLVWLFYVQRYGETWSEARIKAKISRDGAQTWSDSMVIAYELGMMARGRPIVLNDGDYLLPIYHETGGDREFLDATTSSLFLRHNPKTRTWTPTNKILSPKGNLQPEPVQLTDDYLVAYTRRGGGYDPNEKGYIIRAESRDGGRTWSEGRDTAFPNPNAAISFIRLANGHLLLIYNDSMNDRTPLTAALSTDNEKSFPYRKNIGEGPHDFAYPMAIQAKNGTICVLFTRDERQTVNLAEFTEDWLLEP